MQTEAEPRAEGIEQRDRFGLWLAVVAALAAAWRLAYLFISHRSDSNLFDEGDAFYYSVVTNAVARGDGFEKLASTDLTTIPAADHPPLTTLLLAPVARLDPDGVLSLRLTMLVIGVLVVVVIGLLGRTVGGPRLGIVAAVVAAVNPNLWMNDAVVMSEAPSALFIALSLWAGYRLWREPTWGWALATGGLVGVAILARSEMGLLLPFMVVPLLLRARSLPLGTRVLRSAGAVGMAALVVAPWTLYNLGRFDEPVLISANDGLTLWGATCPLTFESGLIGGWALACGNEGAGDSALITGDERALTEEARRLAREAGCYGPGTEGDDDAERSACFRRLAVRYARDHASRLPVVVLARQGRTWGWWRPDQMVYANQGEGRPEWASWAGFAFLWATIPLVVAGSVLLHRRGTTLIPLAACLLTVLVVVTVFYGIPRFRLPYDVAATVPIGVALIALWDRYRTRPA